MFSRNDRHVARGTVGAGARVLLMEALGAVREPHAALRQAVLAKPFQIPLTQPKGVAAIESIEPILVVPECEIASAPEQAPLPDLANDLGEK